MSLLNSTREIPEFAEQISGRPVRAQEEKTLGTLATMTTAHRTMKLGR